MIGICFLARPLVLALRGEGKLRFALIHRGLILPGQAKASTGEFCPILAVFVHSRVADDAVALADGVVKAVRRLPRTAVLIQRLSWQIWMASALRSTP